MRFELNKKNVLTRVIPAVVMLICIIICGAYLGRNIIVKSIVERRLSHATDTQVEIGQLDIDIFDKRVVASNLTMYDKGQNRVVLSIESMDATYELQMLSKYIEISELSLVNVVFITDTDEYTNTNEINLLDVSETIDSANEAGGDSNNSGNIGGTNTEGNTTKNPIKIKPAYDMMLLEAYNNTEKDLVPRKVQLNRRLQEFYQSVEFDRIKSRYAAITEKSEKGELERLLGRIYIYQKSLVASRDAFVESVNRLDATDIYNRHLRELIHHRMLYAEESIYGLDNAIGDYATALYEKHLFTLVDTIKNTILNVKNYQHTVVISIGKCI